MIDDKTCVFSINLETQNETHRLILYSDQGGEILRSLEIWEQTLRLQEDKNYTVSRF